MSSSPWQRSFACVLALACLGAMAAPAAEQAGLSRFVRPLVGTKGGATRFPARLHPLA